MIRKPAKNYNANLQHKCLKPENICLGDRYAFSFNPESQPIVQNFHNVRLTTFSQWADEIYAVFDKCKYCKIETVMEISAGSRLHFHGYITITKLIEFYFYDLKILKFHGSFEIDTIGGGLDAWDDYCIKLKYPMIKFCENNGMKYSYESKDHNA